MRSIWDLANPQLKDLVVYEPGKPIEETARELQIDPAQIIKLASNENPLGPSPAAVAARRDALTAAQLYPDGSGFYLRKAIAARLDVAQENLVLGNGSNEIIEFLAHAFLKPGDSIITSQYAFVAYKLAATLFGAGTIETASPDYRYHLDAVLEHVSPTTRLILIANPNNPTGTLVSQPEINRFMKKLPEHLVAVFDEAYFEFLDDPPDTVRYVREGRNVVVLRTFSKIHGLAGLRIGYGIGPAPMIEVLQKAREPFNVNSVAQAGALAALNDEEHQRRTKQITDQGRAYLTNEFAELGLPFMPSVANFVTVKVGDGPGIFEQMLKRKIIVRPLAGYGLIEWVRISIGTMEQNQKCISVLREILSNRPA
jgi:histidinol-phosphate aminotransferase